MMELILPAVTAIAAITLTYLFCVRPMRRGRCAMGAQTATPARDEQQSRARL